MEVLTVRNIGKDALYGTDQSTWVQTDLGCQAETKKRYVECVMGETVSAFDKWALYMYKRVVHGTTGTLSVFIVPAMVCAMRVINDTRYRDGEHQKGAKRKGTIVIKAYVHLIESCKEKNDHYFYDVSCAGMMPLENIEIGEDKFVDYGKPYAFPRSLLISVNLTCPFHCRVLQSDHEMENRVGET